MDLKDALTAISIGGFVLSFVTGTASQIWKSSVEVEGRFTKRLTPAGWLLLGISMVSSAGSIGSVLVRLNVEQQEALQGQLQEDIQKAQEEALRQQEFRWRDYVSRTLENAKRDIQRNLGNTIRGFQENQTRFNQAQAALAASKQTLLENSLRQTNEIILAGQPLTSLSMRWQFANAKSSLWERMEQGQEQIRQNAEDVQGGRPTVPFEAAEYQWALSPLLSHLARLGHAAEADEAEADEAEAGAAEHDESTLMLIPLDDSQNAILAFGAVPSEALIDHRGQPLPAETPGPRNNNDGGSTPWVTTRQRHGSLYHYAVEWNLDPATLSSVVSRRNAAIAPLAGLPRILKIVLLHNIRDLPVQPRNYSIPRAVNLWDRGEYGREEISLGSELRDMTLRLEANGFQQMSYLYRLRRAYTLDLRDEYDDEIDVRCTVFELELA